MIQKTPNMREFVEDAVRRNPSKVFLHHGQTQVTYSGLDREVNRYANAFLGLDAARGDRVAVMLRNSPEFIYCWLGLAKIGCVIVPVNPQLKTDEVAHILGHSGCRLVITETAKIGTAGAALNRSALSSRVLCIDAESDGETSLSDLARHASASLHETDIGPGDPAVIIYTSGTTGAPKGVVQSHRTYVLTGQSFPHWLGLTSSDRQFTCLPLSHMNAQAYSVMSSIGAEGSLVLEERFSASNFWNAVRRSRATEFNSIGSMMLILQKQEPSEAEREHNVRIAYSGPALPENVTKELEERFGLRIVVGYGMTESTFGTIEPLLPPRKFGSIGKVRQHPLLGNVNSIRVVDDNGAELPAGETGEIVLRNPAIMIGYYNDEERTSEVLRDGWLHTGDLGYFDGDGFLFFFGRKKNIIRRRGENISPTEIEDTVIQHPAVSECAAIAVPSELTEDDIKIFVVCRNGAAVGHRDIVAWCEERLARFKVPRYVEFRESLPKTRTQRVEKHLLWDGSSDFHRNTYDRETDRLPD